MRLLNSGNSGGTHIIPNATEWRTRNSPRRGFADFLHRVFGALHLLDDRLDLLEEDVAGLGGPRCARAAEEQNAHRALPQAKTPRRNR